MQDNEKIAKIYSRGRLELFKNNKNKYRNKNRNNNIKNNKKIKFKFFAFYIFGIVGLFIVFSKSIIPIFEKACLNEAASVATKITNEQSTIVIKNFQYEDIFTIVRDNNGDIKLVNANIFKINEITSDIAENIQKELDNSNDLRIKLPMGVFTGSKYFSGMGPKINIKIASEGEVLTELKSEFLSQGINQTLHRIYLQVDCKINVLTPFETYEKNISNQILLAENVIIGNIPDNYYNFDGIKEKESLELIK